MCLGKRTGSKKYRHGHAVNSHRICYKIRSDLWDGLYRKHEANHSGTHTELINTWKGLNHRTVLAQSDNIIGVIVVRRS